MLGFAPPQGGASPGAAPPIFSSSPKPFGGTMPQATPAMPQAAPVMPAPAAMATPAPVPAPGAVRVGASPLQKTMLGVARPGIAPRHAGEPRPEPSPSVPVAPLPQLEARAAPRSEPSDIPMKRPGFPKSAMVLIAVAALLAVGAGVVAFLWEAPRPIRAEVVLDDRGSEVLVLTCDDCADTTAVSIGGTKATFTSKKARLLLSKPLEIGKNELRVAVRRPGIGRDEEIALNVSVDYRVRGDLSSLAEDPPKVKVLVQAAPSAVVVVDGRPVALDRAGKGEHAIDVSHELEGPADTIVPFERKLPYAVTLPGGGAHQGDVMLRFGIVPLRVDAPGHGIVIEGETFMLSGRTLKDGHISVSGRPITVDAEGRFAQLMNVSSVGETTIVVRAESKGDHAPRLVRVRVKRVASLEDAAAEFRRSATDDYPTIAESSTKSGLPVAVDGEVVETRIDGEVTVLLLDVKTGCAASPCLARVIYGGRFDTKRGAPLGAYGSLLGLVDGPRTGIRIPEIAAEFLLGTAKKKKR
jgi:hypothetical protein